MKTFFVLHFLCNLRFTLEYKQKEQNSNNNFFWLMSGTSIFSLFLESYFPIHDFFPIETNSF